MTSEVVERLAMTSEVVELLAMTSEVVELLAMTSEVAKFLAMMNEVTSFFAMAEGALVIAKRIRHCERSEAIPEKVHAGIWIASLRSQ